MYQLSLNSQHLHLTSEYYLKLTWKVSYIPLETTAIFCQANFYLKKKTKQKFLKNKSCKKLDSNTGPSAYEAKLSVVLLDEISIED